ncbi:serine/threonine-protein kinase [Gordonia sp. (in: high G+C Gram-positive bacteria)]|uniref:serine/threonine-protein kinase n=1 Tax=Gordonia sp. (in: high G+C Gram-positive bacteria) TaxID=84139 RepID=UPI0016BD1E9A|nr:serine/threonine protein kinase [Gordonia sp. (in: high G+C Gram-positive bacteria)]NLG47695.1 protein kinase [Gordonia sp. (in: high G+C Gram-positive bacteria)]
MLSAGQLFANYRIVRNLGVGGMGEVYLAAHPRLPREDALKVLPSELTNDATFRARFTREADLASQLDHSSIVSVYDRGEFDGQLWIAMKYIPGSDCDAMLRESGVPEPRKVSEIVNAVADALDYAHEHGMLHRDVKPANILVDDSSSRRKVYLTDFGIARTITNDTALTAANLTVGSIQYCSPEQLRGSKLDGRSDQYALACTAFRLLTGRAPFPMETPTSIINAHLSTPAPKATTVLPTLAPAVDTVLARAMEKDPARRYRTCGEFASDLEGAITRPGFKPQAPAAYAPTMINPAPQFPQQPANPSAPQSAPQQQAPQSGTPQSTTPFGAAAAAGGTTPYGTVPGHGSGPAQPNQPPSGPQLQKSAPQGQPPSTPFPQGPHQQPPIQQGYQGPGQQMPGQQMPGQPPYGAVPAGGGFGPPPGGFGQQPYGLAGGSPGGGSGGRSGGSSGGRGKIIGIVSAVIVAILLIAVGGYFLFRGNDEPRTTASSSSTTTTPSTSTTTSSPTPTLGTDPAVVAGVPTQCARGTTTDAATSPTSVTSGNITIPADKLPTTGWTPESQSQIPFATRAAGLAAPRPTGASSWVAQITVGNLPTSFGSNTDAIAKKLIDCLPGSIGYQSADPSEPRITDTRTATLEDNRTPLTLVRARINVGNHPGVSGDDIILIVIDTTPMAFSFGVSPADDKTTQDEVEKAVMGFKVRTR